LLVVEVVEQVEKMKQMVVELVQEVIVHQVMDQVLFEGQH
jgi:hypothetical protein